MSKKTQTSEVVIRGSGGIEVSRDEKKEVSEGGYVTGDEGFHRLRCDIRASHVGVLHRLRALTHCIPLA